MSLGFGLGLQYSRLSGGGGGYNAFIIEVKTDNAGTSNDNQFQFTGAEGDYDVVAKQNDIIVQTFNNLSGEETITFANGAGTYILGLTPKEVSPFNRIEFANSGDKNKIIDTKQYGNIIWSSFKFAFFGCVNMSHTATDEPDLTNVTDLSSMFRIANNANANVSNWKTGNIQNMNNMFQGYDGNPDVSNWDVSSLVQAGSVFRNASNANPDCRNWKPTSLTDASNMLTGSDLSVENLTAIYTKWPQLTLQQNVAFSAGNTQYNASGQAGRDILVNTYNWIIEDGGQV